jgi:hypothetical protein
MVKSVVPNAKSISCIVFCFVIVTVACYIVLSRNNIQNVIHASNYVGFIQHDIVQQKYNITGSHLDHLDIDRSITSNEKRSTRRSMVMKQDENYIPIHMFRSDSKKQQQSSSETEYVFYNIKPGSNGLGESNPDAAVNNPLKGLVGKPRSNNIDTTIQSTLDYYDIGLDEVMFSNPKTASLSNTTAFDWSITDAILNDSANRNKHVIWRFIAQDNDIQKTLRIPSYLIDSGMEIVRYNRTDTVGGTIIETISLKYDDPILLDAYQSFITALGQRYDNDTRLAFLQMGLIGFGGNGYTDEFAPENLIPYETLEQITWWYKNAFPNSKLQAWYSFPGATNTGIGYIDTSFAYSTLDGIYNGFINDTTYFWPMIVTNKQEQFWHTNVMGGETHPDLQSIIFQNTYPAFTEHHQDFSLCVDMTHATYIVHETAFNTDTSLSDTELVVALSNHARMGYNFYVSDITVLLDVLVAVKERNTINIDVTIKQSGVAPFYYPLNVLLTCTGMIKPIVISGVEKLVKPSDEMPFRFNNVSATDSCLRSIQIYLESPYLYPQQRIKLAQEFVNESTGGIDVFLPTPTNSDWDNAMNGVLMGFTLMEVKDTASIPIRSIFDGDTIDLLDVGKRLSIRGDVNETSSSGSKSTIHHIIFSWGGKTKVISTGSPWALNGYDDDGNFVTVRYLANIGSKTVTAKAYNNNNQLIGYLSVNFTIINTMSPKTTRPRPTIINTPQAYPIQRPIKYPMTSPDSTVTKSPIGIPVNKPAISPIRTVAPTHSSDIGIVFKSFTLINTDNMFDFPYKEIKQGSYISIDPVDKQFSIACRTSSNVDSVMFHWNGQSHRTTTSTQPWVLNGRTENKLYNPVPYLGTMGTKIIMAAAFKNGTILATKTLTFTLIPTIKPR